MSLGTGPGGASAGFSQQNVNVAQSTIKGFELETRFDLPFRSRLDIITAYIDAKADSGALTDTRGTDYGDGTPNFNIDIADNDLPNVSKVNINAHLQKTADLFGGRADFHLLANYRSSYYLNIYNEAPVIQFADRPSDAAGQAAYDAFKASMAGTTVNPNAPLSSPFLRSTSARDGGFWARQEGYVTVNLGAGWEPSSGRYRIEAYVNNVFDKTVVEKQLVSDEVVIDGNREAKIRFAEIDAPEKGQPWGNRSKQTLSDLVFGRDVRVQQMDVDRWGRIVGRVFVDNRDVNREMVAVGAAWVFRRYLTDTSLIEVEVRAKRERVGLWSMPEAQTVAPWDWRRGTSTGPVWREP